MFSPRHPSSAPVASRHHREASRFHRDESPSAISRLSGASPPVSSYLVQTWDDLIYLDNAASERSRGGLVSGHPQQLDIIVSVVGEYHQPKFTPRIAYTGETGPSNVEGATLARDGVEEMEPQGPNPTQRTGPSTSIKYSFIHGHNLTDSRCRTTVVCLNESATTQAIVTSQSPTFPNP